MLIAIDYDGTYTAYPELWDNFIRLARSRMHVVMIVTMRADFEPVRLGATVDRVIYTDRKAKLPFLKRLNLTPQIWVDDRPDFILEDAVARSLTESAKGPFWDDA